jgi:hypothetical protein
MSEATLKKKSRVLYNNLSVGSTNGFSLNGGHRSAGYIGQSTQSRHLTRTLMKGNVVRGVSGCCGTYVITNVNPSELACLNNPNIVKPSVQNTESMLHTKYKWFWSGKQNVKPDSNQNGTQSDYVTNIAKETVKCANSLYEVPTEKSINCDILPALARPRINTLVTSNIRQRPICPNTKTDTTATGYDKYLQKLDDACTANDIVYPSHNTNAPLPGFGSSVGSV